MAIGTHFQTRLTAQDVREIHSALDRLDDARVSCELAAGIVQRLPAVFANEATKLRRSAEALRWERGLLDVRLRELLEKGRRAGGCPKCGCEVSAAGLCACCVAGP